jgi:hypothetical protein
MSTDTNPKGHPMPSSSHLLTAATAGRGRLLAVLLVAGLILVSALAAARAEAAPVYYESFHQEGYGDIGPFYDTVSSFGQDAESVRWSRYSAWWTGPGGHQYAMFRGSNGNCLDVKQGAATAGAELTTSPCVWSRNSQWWAIANGTLTPWHAAEAGLVATTHYPANPWAWARLVLEPRVGFFGNLEQQFTRVTHVIPH